MNDARRHAPSTAGPGNGPGSCVKVVLLILVLAAGGFAGLAFASSPAAAVHRGPEPVFEGPSPHTRDDLATFDHSFFEFLTLDAREMYPAFYEMHYGTEGGASSYGFNEIMVGWKFFSGMGYFSTNALLRLDHENIMENTPYMKEYVKVELALTARDDVDVGSIGAYRITTEWDQTTTFGSPSRPEHHRYPGPVSWEKDVVYDTVDPGQANVTYYWNITDLFTEWVDGTHPNYGVCLSPVDPPTGKTAPAAGEPTQPHQYLSTSSEDPMTPSIRITYIDNKAPVPNIDDIAPSKPVDGDTITLSGSAYDPDGDGVSSYKWWTASGLIAEGPDAAETSVSLSVGLHKIYFSARDNHPTIPRWSGQVNAFLEVKEKGDQVQPLVTGVDSSSKGIAGTVFPEGSIVDIKVTESHGLTGLTGGITIRGLRTWVDQEPLYDNLDGTYTYIWDTQGIPAGDYTVDVTLVNPVSGVGDIDGLLSGTDLSIALTDISPPSVSSVTIPNGVEDGVIQPGDRVTIRVREDSGESTCTGRLNIKGPVDIEDQKLSNSGGGIYTYVWDTSNLPQGEYSIDATLTDIYGNVDANGVDQQTPDLMVRVMDTRAPEVLSVFSVPSDGWVEVRVQEAFGEGDLEGVIFIDGPEYFEAELEDDGNGWYFTRINTTDLEPGLYSIETTLWDSNANVDPDGLIQTPDASFIISVRNVPPHIVLTYPSDGDEVSDIRSPVEAVFSEPVYFDGDMDWAVLVWNEDGEMVTGTAFLESGNTILRFTPEGSWRGGGRYRVFVSPGLKDDLDAGLLGPTSWSFTVPAFESPTIDDTSPPDDSQVYSGTPLMFSANMSGVDSITWYVDGNQTGTGTAFEFTPNGTGLYLVEVVGESPGGNATSAWEVRVYEDTPQQQDGGDGGETEIDPLWLEKILMGTAIVFLLIIAILQYTRTGGISITGPGGEGKGRSPEGKTASVTRQPSKDRKGAVATTGTISSSPPSAGQPALPTVHKVSSGSSQAPPTPPTVR